MRGKPDNSMRSRLMWLLVISHLSIGAAWSFNPEAKVAVQTSACAGAEAQINAAKNALDQGNLAEAERALTPLESSHSQCSEVLVGLGRLRAARNDVNKARELFERACKIDPDNPEAHFQLGGFFDSRQLHPEAVAQFEKVIALRPRDPRAYDFLALNLEALGETEKAEAAYMKGSQVNKGPLFDSFLDYNYGRFLMKANRLTESKEYLDRALRLAPGTRAVYYEHGRLNFRLQRYMEAQADAERALSLPDPTGFVLDLQVYYLLASIYSRLGNAELARKYAALCRTSRGPIQSQGRGDR